MIEEIKEILEPSCFTEGTGQPCPVLNMDTNQPIKICLKCDKIAAQLQALFEQEKARLLEEMISRAEAGLDAEPETADPYWKGYWKGLKDYAQAKLNALKSKKGGE